MPISALSAITCPVCTKNYTPVRTYYIFSFYPTVVIIQNTYHHSCKISSENLCSDIVSWLNQVKVHQLDQTDKVFLQEQENLGDFPKSAESTSCPRLNWDLLPSKQPLKLLCFCNTPFCEATHGTYLQQSNPVPIGLETFQTLK